MIDRRVDISQTGKLWIGLASFAVLLYVLWELSNSIAGGSLKLAALIGAAFAAFFIAGRIAHDWRSGVYYFLFWLLFEDLIRKYMNNNMVIYFVKDVLVAGVYASFVVGRMKERLKPFHPPFRYALGAFFIFGLIQVFNPWSPSIFYGLLGLKLYFYYIPLMFVGYALFQDERDLPRFFAFNMALAGVIAWVGIMQSIVGQTFLNPHSGEDIDELSHLTRYTHSGLALTRPPSVFVSEGRFGTFMLVAFILGLGGAGYMLLQSRRGRIFVFPGLGLVIVGGLMTGSRGAVVYFSATALLLTAGMLWGAPLGKAGSYRLVKAIRRSFVFIAVAMALAVTIFPDVIGARLTFYKETLMPNSEYSEVELRTWDYPVRELKNVFNDPHWVVGHGIGTGSLGVQYVTRILAVPPPRVGVENGYGTLILELGVIGPIIWILWSLGVLVAMLKTTLKLKGTWAFPIAISVLWFGFVLLYTLTWGGLVQYQNFIPNAYFWLMVGVLFRLPDLVKKGAADKAETPALAT